MAPKKSQLSLVNPPSSQLAPKNSQLSLAKSPSSSMPPKNFHTLEDPPAASSSEDEDVSSSEEETTDLDGEKKQNLTKDEEEDNEEETYDVPTKQPEKTKNNNNMEDSESESESEKLKSVKGGAVKSPTVKPVLANPGLEKSNAGVVGLLAKSAAKRPALKMEYKGEEKKWAKTAENGKDRKTHGTKTSKKLMFQRLFNDDDEIILLQGMVDFTGTIGDPYEDMDGFCKFIKNSLNCEASRPQIVDKIRRLKKKYDKGVEKVYPKAHDQKSFDLWKKFWGKEGALHKEGKKKIGEMNVIGNSSDIMYCTNIVVSVKDVAALLKKTGLDETAVMQGWNTIDGMRKKQLEEKFKKLQVVELEVFLKRNELNGEIGKEISKKIKVSHASV